MSEEILTVSEAANKLGVSPRTTQRYCKQGRLNNKWIKGKRHKELRILPPILIDQLPGGRRRNLAGTFNYVTKTDLEKIISTLKNNLDEKDHQISSLEIEIEKLKSSIGEEKGSQDISPDYYTTDRQLKEKMDIFLHEFEKVRPAEKRLILKIAKEIQALEKRLQ